MFEQHQSGLNVWGSFGAEKPHTVPVPPNKTHQHAVPSLDDWEKQWKENPQAAMQAKVLPVNFRNATGAANTPDADSAALAVAERN